MGSWQLVHVDAVARLTLTRPPINTLDQEALDDLSAILVELAASSTTRALVVTGGARNAFCTGGDLKYWRGVRDAGRVSESGRSTFLRLERLDIPTIAALNGNVIGDGLALALACDLRIGCEATCFRLPELAYGFIPGWGPIRPLIGVIGRAEATKMLLTGRPYDAANALEIGLVHEVVASEQLLETALARERTLSALSARALRAAKRALRGADERECFQEVWGKEDWEEGIAALLEKRPPRFAGKGATE